MPRGILSIVTVVEGSLLVLLQLYTAAFHKHSRVGPWVLFEGLSVFIGASCMLIKVVLLPLPHF